MSAPEPTPPDDQTQVLLKRWHAGDRDALGELVGRNREWIDNFVRRKLGDRLRSKDQTQDIVQEALVEFLEYGPRFELANERHFRGLLAKIVRNVLADRHAWYSRRRRDMHLERPMPGHTTLQLDAAVRSVTQPDAAAARAEEHEMMRLALDLMRPDEREVIVRRMFDQEEFSAIGTAMDLSAEAARKRYGRALVRMNNLVRKLRDGHIEDLIADDDE